MKTVGIIGGIGPESTIEYYRQIIASYQEQKPDGSYPSILINSINLQKIIDLVTANELPALTDYLAGEIETLARAGADFGVITANTPHIIFDEIQKRSPIPLISIVEATCQAAKDRGLHKLGLIGTRFTMQGRFFPDQFSREGITLVTPNQDEQAYIHDKYMNELLKGNIRPETREGLLAIVHRLKDQDGIQGLILGGTELPLILENEHVTDFPLLDTTQIHVSYIVSMLLS
jgi:aspartate racemase